MFPTIASMAWRLEQFVEHGEIDNTVPGTTTGRIWLRGMDEPLLLALYGDCWRDLAGARLEFTNPAPQAGANFTALDPDQVGIIGDMTAALRVPPNARKNEPNPQWRNALYLEWFSDVNGRVLIESTRFKLRLTGHEWCMDEDEEQAQKLANLQAMRDFMAHVIGRQPLPENPLPEEEELLKQSERVSRAFGEVLEKYGDDPESERKEAFVMGWDRKLEALADREEALSAPMPPGYFDDGDEDDDEPLGDDPWSTSSDPHHEGFADREDDGYYCDEEPVVEKARELCLQAMSLVDRDAEAGSPADLLTSRLLEVSSKLAGAFECVGDGDDAESILHVIAVLKRCLALINECLGALQALAGNAREADHQDALEQLMSGVFSVRDDVVELRRELRGER